MGSNVYRKVRFLTGFYPIPVFEFDSPVDFQEVTSEPPGEPEDLPVLEKPPDLDLVRREAEGILSEASRKRDDLLSAAHAEAARLREEAIRQGYEEGRLQGTADAGEKLQREAERRRLQFLTLLQSVQGEKTKILEESEGELADLALEIARTVIREEIRSNREIPVRLAREAISRLTRKTNVSIRIHPDDAELLNLAKEELLRQGDLEEIRIIPDPRVERGGCLVESDGGQVDGRIDVQLGEVKRALNLAKEEGRPRPPHARES